MTLIYVLFLSAVLACITARWHAKVLARSFTNLTEYRGKARGLALSGV